MIESDAMRMMEFNLKETLIKKSLILLKKVPAMLYYIPIHCPFSHIEQVKLKLMRLSYTLSLSVAISVLPHGTARIQEWVPASQWHIILLCTRYDKSLF